MEFLTIGSILISLSPILFFKNFKSVKDSFGNLDRERLSIVHAGKLNRERNKYFEIDYIDV